MDGHDLEWIGGFERRPEFMDFGSRTPRHGSTTLVRRGHRAGDSGARVFGHAGMALGAAAAADFGSGVVSEPIT